MKLNFWKLLPGLILLVSLALSCDSKPEKVALTIYCTSDVHGTIFDYDLKRKGERMKLINIGYGNTVNSDRVIAAVSADAAPVKRIISAAKDNNTAIDATCGKKTKTVIITDSNHVVLSALDISHFTGITAGEEVNE